MQCGGVEGDSTHSAAAGGFHCETTQLATLTSSLFIAGKKTSGISKQQNLSFHLGKEVIHSEAIRSKGGRFELLTAYLNMRGADTFISYFYCHGFSSHAVREFTPQELLMVSCFLPIFSCLIYGKPLVGESLLSQD